MQIRVTFMPIRIQIMLFILIRIQILPYKLHFYLVERLLYDLAAFKLQKAGFRIRIDLMRIRIRIRIQHFFLIADPESGSRV